MGVASGISICSLAHASNIETFEGYSAGYNIAQNPDLGAFLTPGNLEQFTFKSGITLLRPIPNPVVRLRGSEDDPIVQGLMLADWSRGGAPFCFEIDCVGSTSVVPSGSAYLAYNGYESGGPLDFYLPSLSTKFSVLATGQSPVTLTAYSAAGSTLAVSTIQRVGAAAWRNNVLAVSGVGISRVAISGNFFVLDDMSFVSVVPEPSAWILMLVGIGLIGFFFRQQNRG